MFDNTLIVLLESAFFTFFNIAPQDFHIGVSVRPALVEFFLLIYRFDKPSEMEIAQRIFLDALAYLDFKGGIHFLGIFPKGGPPPPPPPLLGTP